MAIRPMAPGQGVPEEERLPWLEPAAAAPRRGKSRRGVWLVAILLIAAALLAVALWRGAERTGGAPGLILAPPGPYKVKPPQAGGMTVEGAGYTSYAASEGGDPRGRIDTAAVAEAPVVRPRAAAPAPGAAAPAAAPATADAASGSGTIQLGAFSTEAKANAAWKALSARFSFLALLTPVIAPRAVEGGGTVYRLRAAAGATAIAVCGRLRVAGESCQVVAR